MSAAKAQIRIEQVASPIGRNRKQAEVLRTLGLRRIRHVVVREDSPAVRGAVARIPHLVRVLDGTDSPAGPAARKA